MTTIKELLGQGDVQKPKRNFLQENVRKLKEMKLEKTNKLNSQRNKMFQPLSERRNAQTMTSGTRKQQTHSAASRMPFCFSPPRNRRSAPGRDRDKQGTDAQETLPTVDNTPKGYRSQGSQTLNAKQLETLYYDGVIRYPTARLLESREQEPVHSVTVREMGLQTEAQMEVIHPPPDESGLHWDEEKDDNVMTGPKDFVKMNATIPDPARNRTGETGRSDPTRAPPTYQRGVVPRYLKEHKKEMERVRITKAKEAGDECPEGHILLPDEVRLKHLMTLKQNYGDLVSQLNQLPVSTDTLRTRTRKKQIETDLDKIEAAITLFTREKVFVKTES